MRGEHRSVATRGASKLSIARTMKPSPMLATLRARSEPGIQ